jgi:hypothetical protein
LKKHIKISHIIHLALKDIKVKEFKSINNYGGKE